MMAVAAVVSVVSAGSAAGQTPAYTPPRTQDGQPDLQGIWQVLNTAAWDIEDHNASLGVPAGRAVVEGGAIRYQPWALAARDAHRAGLARGWPGETGERLYMDPQTFCMKSVPRYSQRGYELVQTPGHVLMMLNWGHVHRSIPIDGPTHPASKAKFWMGNPRGHWEGDTLVVEVTNLNGKMWLDSVGNFYSENARVVERLRLASANQMDYEVTIDDPTVFTQPVTLSYVLQRAGAGRGGGGANATPDPYAVESWEHACHEGNAEHIEEAHRLGFKWYSGEVRPE
jgi:hypothetical protein